MFLMPCSHPQVASQCVLANGHAVPPLKSNSRYPLDAHLSTSKYEGSELYCAYQISTERHSVDASPSALTYSLESGKFDTRDEIQQSRPDAHQTTSFPLSRRYSAVVSLYNLDVDNLSDQNSAEGETTRTSVSPSDYVPKQSAPPKRKSRREKPRIELAPDQPPTTQGKPRCRVYVACIQCRARKIRCDGAKPICHNCSRRTTGSNQCSYDPIPKRRGPDKTPGARQRILRDTSENSEAGPLRHHRRRRNVAIPLSTETIDQHLPPEIEQRSVSDGSIVLPQTLLLATPTESNVLSPTEFLPFSTIQSSPEAQYTTINQDATGLKDFLGVTVLETSASLAYDNNFELSPVTSLEEYKHTRNAEHGHISEVDEDKDEDLPSVSCEPSLNFTRKIWWDALLSLYIYPSSHRQQLLTPAQRASATHGITSDIRFLFNASNYWFAFFHLPSFYGKYFDPAGRERIQPSLILALLAMSTFWQSSEVGFGSAGRERALRFRDEAQGALDASFNAGWIDETLAQAAWLLALFEVCAHPLHSSQRSNSSMIMLDSIIHSLSLTFVDADNPKATTFSPGTVPAVFESTTNGWFDQEQDFNPHMPRMYRKSSRPSQDDLEEAGCSCRLMTLNTYWPESSEHTPLWTLTPAWSNSWSEAEIRKESCRRLCWSSMILAAGHASYTTAHRSSALDLFISDPSNYALLFSGESIAYSPTLTSHHSSKDTIWALHDRSFLLWHGCMQMRSDTRSNNDVKAQFAVKTWLEADAIEAALNKHTCRIERQFIFQAREYIFNTRMCISYEFQRFVPLVTANVNGLFHRNKAEEWLTHQATVAERFMFGLHTITGNSNNLLSRRPFFVFWFMSQISRALLLWDCDNTLTVAVDVCNAFLPALDYLTALWPCPEQRLRYDALRERLAKACYAAGVNAPPPSNLSLPLLSPEH